MAAPSKMAVCPSWPQAWETPSFSEAKGNSVSSCTGNASMSALMAIVRPGFSPTSRASTLVSVGLESSKPAPKDSSVS